MLTHFRRARQIATVVDMTPLHSEPARLNVVDATSWSDRVMVSVVWLSLAAVSAPVLVDALLREHAVVLTLRQAMMAQIVRAFLWLAALVPLARVFDATPVSWARGWVMHRAWWRAVLVRIAALLVIALVHGSLFWIVEQTVGPLVGVPSTVLDHSTATWLAEVMASVEELAPPVLVYLLLRRIVRGRMAKERARQSEQALKSAREHVLAAQLQPHFLFNVLNGIALLTRTDPRSAERMIVKLAALMREVMDVSRSSHELADELRLLDDYLALQQMRFGDRVLVVRDIDASLLSRSVPRLVLQPLVENALRHGLEPVAVGGTLTIRARAEVERGQSRMILEVEDDGVGPPVAGVVAGVGLSITEARLRLWTEGHHTNEALTHLEVVARAEPERGTCSRLYL